MPALRVRLQMCSRNISSTTVNLPNANWNNDQVKLNRNNPDNSNDNLRTRPWMNGDVLSQNIIGLQALRSSQPASQHSSDFAENALHLEDFGFIRKSELEKKTKFESCNFQLTAGFD